MALGPTSQPPYPRLDEKEGEEEEEVGGGSPSTSKYSSCGESEFDRYCSATSALGTPSISGSLGPAEGLDGSPGNFELRGCGWDSCNLGGGEVVLRLSDLERRTGSGSSGWVVGKERGGEGSSGVSEKGEGFGGLDMGENEEEDGDDGSMYGCDSGDENGGGRLSVCGGRVDRGGWKPRDWNPLVMGSSVAFGSDDWDDFEQENGGGVPLASSGLDVFEQMEGRPAGCSKEDLSGAPDVVDWNELEMDGSEVVRDIPVAVCQVQGCDDSAKNNDGTSISLYDLDGVCDLEQDYVRDIFETGKLDHSSACAAKNIETMPTGGILEMEQDPLLEKVTSELGSSIKNCGSDRGTSYVQYEDAIHNNKGKSADNHRNRDLEVQVDHPFDIIKPLHSQLSERPVRENALTTLTNESSVDENLSQNDSGLAKADCMENNGSYDEIVNEMEQILLDSGESSGARFSQGINTFQSHQSLPLRDGGSSASTSGTDDALSLISRPLRIDGVEVIAAKQKKGDVSFSERLVGVKEYTVYVIRVWSGQDQWEVERRYRDFYTLYRRLKSYFADHGWTLPSPWSAIEQESRKIFGSASPDVVSERSARIQECLLSIIHSGVFSSSPSAVAWFLYPPETFPNSPAAKAQQNQSIISERMDNIETVSYLGKPISLIVEVQPCNSMKQMLEIQHYKCAGCHKHFDDGMTLLRDFVQSLGWGRPRHCEYTGQLFCSSCHTNQTAIIPARVLHHWDFTQYPVSELSKSYLDSIHDQPMLCVSAVNPFLFSKVPALHHVMSVRKRIGTLLLYVRCPFRMNINQGLGSRRYLLESNDFFSLRDLIDFSKGAFAALPVMLETVSRKIIEHITDQCLICCDVGVPCSAQQACNDPSSLIFPFQEDNISKCKSCGSVFHKPCFNKLTDCSCGAELGAHNAFTIGNKLRRMSSANLFGKNPPSSLPAGWLTRLFPKTNLQDTEGHKDDDTTILMGSLPTTAL